MYLGHNQDYSDPLLPLCAIDPMQGIDFMRYQGAGSDTRGLIARWAEWCEIYGIEPDLKKALWWPCRDAAQPDVLNELAKIRLRKSA